MASGSASQMAVAKRIVTAFDTLFSDPHKGMRPVHTKGSLCEGTFIASDAARSLSRAPHFQGQAVPVIVRFSNFAGLPVHADGSPLGSPRGMAIKFMLPDGADTDIVAHSYNGFPVSTPEDFLAFLQSLADKDPQVLAAFLAAHPAARTFLNASKPAPVSFATETFYGVNAFVFTNAEGMKRHGRYRLEPLVGSAHLSGEDAARRAPDYLSQDLSTRLQTGTVQFRLLVQLPAENDALLDGSSAWPDDRPVIEIGVLTLRAHLPAEARNDLLFTPLNLSSGIASSGDPLLSARTRAYRISHERRQQPAAAAAAE